MKPNKVEVVLDSISANPGPFHTIPAGQLRCQSLGCRIRIDKGLYNQGLELKNNYENQHLLRLFLTQ
jgi:hypothetical protein